MMQTVHSRMSDDPSDLAHPACLKLHISQHCLKTVHWPDIDHCRPQFSNILWLIAKKWGKFDRKAICTSISSHSFFRDLQSFRQNVLCLNQERHEKLLTSSTTQMLLDIIHQVPLIVPIIWRCFHPEYCFIDWPEFNLMQPCTWSNCSDQVIKQIYFS